MTGPDTDEQRVVDLIAEEIENRKLAVAPRLMGEEECHDMEAEVVASHGRQIVGRGFDIDGRPFIEIVEKLVK